MDTVEQLLAGKSRRVIATSAAASVRQATRLMNDHGIGSLLVITGGRLDGIFTEATRGMSDGARAGLVHGLKELVAGMDGFGGAQ